ncbi:MAG: sodium:calcium antiporter [Hyphomicrobiales bacterium]|nr:sodium:calcium antiporter [Hyphomicrobiales bacterium]
MTATWAWPVFVLCAAAIAFAGPRLVRYADIIGWRSNVSRSWIGLVLLSTATSLPELITGVSSVTVVKAPDIAVGDVLGSCMFNLLMIVLLDALCREKSLFVSVTQGHVLTAGFGVISIGVAGVAILSAGNGQLYAFAGIGIATPVLALAYIGGMRTIYHYESRQQISNAIEPVDQTVSMRDAIIGYGLMATVIVVAAVFLPISAVAISKLMGWGQAFVGSLFVAAATSLPELAVTIAALRIRALDLAIANLLGSNLFNILILAIDDIAYRDGPLLASASNVHALTAFLAAIMSGIVIVALVSRTGHRFRGLFGWASIFLLAAYVVGVLAAYNVGN